MSDRADRLRALLGRDHSTTAHGKPTNRPELTPVQSQGILETNFHDGNWSGLVNHLCNVCGCGFLDHDNAVDHWISEHSGWTPPPELGIVETGLVSATGNPILKQVELAPDEPKEVEE